MSINVDTPPRCAVCHRDAHRSGWQGHYYVAPAPFLSELTAQERSDLSIRFAQASKQYDRLCGFLIDRIQTWESPARTEVFKSVIGAWQELRELRTDLHAVTTA